MNWPNREEWAKQRRTPYYDRFDDIAVSTKLSDLCHARRDRPGGSRPEDAAHRSLPANEFPTIDADERCILRGRRSGIGKVLRRIAADRGGVVGRVPLALRYGATEVLKPFDERYIVALEAAEEKDGSRSRILPLTTPHGNGNEAPTANRRRRKPP